MEIRTHPHPEVGPYAQPEAPRRPGELSWPVVGGVAGAVGASVIALFFLCIDMVEREALWTPTALGSLLFLGERVAEHAAPRPVLVVAYTALHGAAFLAVGLMAAFALVQRREPPTPVGGVALAVLLFGVFEIMILGFFQFASPTLVATFGALRITLANLLASVAMAAFLTWVAPRVGGP